MCECASVCITFVTLITNCGAPVEAKKPAITCIAWYTLITSPIMSVSRGKCRATLLSTSWKITSIYHGELEGALWNTERQVKHQPWPFRVRKTQFQNTEGGSLFCLPCSCVVVRVWSNQECLKDFVYFDRCLMTKGRTWKKKITIDTKCKQKINDARFNKENS